MVLTAPYVVAGGRRAPRDGGDRDDRSRAPASTSTSPTSRSPRTTPGGDLQVTRIERDEPHEAARSQPRHARAASPARARPVAARRRTARSTSCPSARRSARAAATAAGLPPVEVIPTGPRDARADGRPLQTLSQGPAVGELSARRAAQAADAAAARAGAARSCAAGRRATSSPTHGCQLVVEDCSRSPRGRASWGRARRGVLAGHAGRRDRSRGARGRCDRRRRVAASSARRRGRPRCRSTACAARASPSARRPRSRVRRLRAARRSRRGRRGARVVCRARRAAASRRRRASTTPRHATRCLRHPRDVLSTLLLRIKGWQDALSESTDLSARDGSFVAWTRPTPDSRVVVARRTVGMAPCPTRDETGARQTTSERARDANQPVRQLCAETWT